MIGNEIPGRRNEQRPGEHKTKRTGIVRQKGNSPGNDGMGKVSSQLAPYGKRVANLKAVGRESKRVPKGPQESEKLAKLGELASSLAHSIRNPLTSIRMRLYSLKRLGLPPAQTGDLEVICEEISYLDNIIQDFLEFARPFKLKKQKSSPSDVVDKAVQLFRDHSESNRVDLRIRRKSPLSAVSIDPARLKEALLNLLLNAGEALEKGNGSIVIEEEAGVVEQLGPVVNIKVSDNGIGIPDVIQSEVFEPFFTSKETGTGLGLSIAKRIVHEHGGRIDLDSNEGSGASFTITLPMNDCRSLNRRHADNSVEDED